MNRKFTNKLFAIGDNYLLIPLIIIAFIISFIWFGLRPASINEECHRETTQAVWSGGSPVLNTNTSIQYQTLFEMCTNKAGL